ncbi:MAG TPA: prolipoprotein diacylglyceryl transferase, partial [Rhodocyclaceae bacterium]|nr:prolipoprotein diacylglyceryl transferase [Rhodocyclaceae bacterium]
MLVHPQFNPVALSIGPLDVRWYGLMYLTAFILFVALGRAHARRRPELGWDAQQIDDLLFYGVLGVILGGRLGYILFYKPAYYFSHPVEMFAVWQGGMAFHGGFLGVLIAVWLFARSHDRPWLAVTDFIAPL